MEEQQKFEKKRADEIFETVRRAKFVAKKRAADITKEVEVRDGSNGLAFPVFPALSFA